jgi:hypothetical protein
MMDPPALASRSARLLDGQRCWHQPQCPDALAPDRIAAHAEWTADNITGRAQENREYVRRLLKERQPDFAAALESVVRELACQMRSGPG